MIADVFIKGEKKKYRVSLISNPKLRPYQYDMELNCIDEDHGAWSVINLPYAKARELMSENKIKLII
jgi:hypothetical protein